MEKACQFLVDEGIFIERAKTYDAAIEVAPGPTKRKVPKIERIAIKGQHMDKILLSGTVSPMK